MRWIFRLLSLAVLLILAGVALFFLVPAERIAGLVEERFEAATGRALSVEGDVRPRLWPELGVATGAISVANAPWSDSGPMLTAEALTVSVDWGTLFGGDIRITGVTLEAPEILLETGPDGTGNWVFGPADAPAGTPAPGTGEGAPATLPAFALDRAEIRRGAITWRDPAGTEIAARDLDATLALPAFDGPLALAGTARVNGAPASFAADLPSLAAFLGRGAPGARLALDLGDAAIRFEGSAGLAPLEVAGRLDADLGALAGLTAALGMPPPELPQGLGRERLALAGNMALTEGSLALIDPVITADQNRLTGALGLAWGGARPKLEGHLESDRLDLSALGGAEEADGAAPAGADGPGGWSTEPIDASGLSALDAAVTLTAGEMLIGESVLGRTRLHLTLENGRLVTEIEELNAYDGQVTGSFVVNGRGGLSVRTDLQGSAIAISRLLAELLDYDRIFALGDLRLSALGSGPSMNAIMNSLDGEGAFEFGAGELLGFDLVGMLTHLDLGYLGEGRRTIFDSISGSFRIVDGVVINEDLAFLAPLLKAAGSGQVGLGGQTLNYRLVPELLSGEQAGLKVPLLITGTWDAPRFRLDLAAVAEERARGELEDKLREEVGEKLGAPEEGQSVEEQVKDALEDKLKERLRGLFD